jgi:hypothetical protein
MAYKDKEKERAYNKQYAITHKEQKNQNQRKWREKHKKDGLCRDCNKPHIKDNIRCLFHLTQNKLGDRKYYCRIESCEKRKLYLHNRYHKLKSENKCVCCGMPLDEESRMGASCVNCYITRNRTNY